MPQPVPEHRRARRRDRLRLRRGAADHRRRTRSPDAPCGRGRAAAGVGLRRDRGAARHALPPLRASTTTARSSTRRSSRRPRRTSSRSRRTCAASSAATPSCRTTSCATSASRRSATTTRASPAPRTSSTSRSSAGERRVVVIGVGNAVPRRRRGRASRSPSACASACRQTSRSLECEQEPTRLLDAWEGADVAVVVDAVRVRRPPGRVHRFDASERPAARAAGSARRRTLRRRRRRRALARPRPAAARVVVYGVEGAAFDAGAPSERRRSQAAAEQVAAAIVRELETESAMHERALIQDLVLTHRRGRERGGGESRDPRHAAARRPVALHARALPRALRGHHPWNGRGGRRSRRRDGR